MSDSEQTVTKFQRYTTRRVHRSEIKNAPYNPRTIGPQERKKLQGIIKKLKLLGPPTWNEANGHIVGGHQRIAIVDQLEGHADYYIDVACVKLTDKQEREANLALNNQGAQGQWDMGALANMLRPGDLDLESVGMSRMDLEIMFEDDPTMSKLFSEETAPPALKAAMADIERGTEEANAMKAPRGAPPPSPEEAREAIKGKRKEHRAAMDEKNDTEFYSVLVFVDRGHREIFMRHVGKDSDDKYVDGHHVARLCGLSFE